MAWVLRKLKSVAEVTRFDIIKTVRMLPASHQRRQAADEDKTNATEEANRVPKTNATDVSGVLQTNVTEAVESPELFLKHATECMDRVRGVMSTAHSLKFNHNQSEYLAGKLKMAVQSADLFFRSLNSTSGSTWKFESMELCLETFKLLFVLSSKVEAFIGSCCKEAWINSAILLETNMMEHISSIGFMLEFCRMIFSDEVTARSRLTEDHTCMTKVALSKLSNAEAQVVKEKASLDHARSCEDLSGLIRSSESSSQERELATFLLGRMNMIGGLHSGSDVPGNQRSRLKILKESLSVLPQKLGNGAFGTVHKATWLGADVAVKTFHGPSGGSESDFMKEVSILEGLCHPNIGALLWHTVNEHEGRIILELMDDDLDSFMRKRLSRSGGSAPFTISEAVDIMLQVGEGMLFLHEKHIVHRDLKSGNILVKCVKTGSARFDYLHVKVADFGLSKTKEKSMTYSNQTPNMGTTRWMAPEMIKIMSNDGGDWKAKTEMKLKYPLKSDVYSFGMIYHTLKRLIVDCWSLEASHRPTFGEICAQLRHIKCGPFMPLCCRSSEMELQIKCEVCNNFCPKNAAGLVEFHTIRFWNMKYCPHYERDDTPRCCSCDRLENKVDGVYVEIGDGRRVCLCYAYRRLPALVPGNSQLLRTRTWACQSSRKFRRYWLDEMPSMLKNLMQRIYEGCAFQKNEQTLRCCKLFGEIRCGARKNLKLTACEVIAMLVLHGLPRLLTGSILASELMHAWLLLQGTYPHLRPEVEGGIRKVMSHIWLTSELKKLNGKRSSSSPNNREISVEARLGEFYLHQISTNPSRIAGDGFHLAMASVQEFGLSRVLEHLERTGNFPLMKGNSLNASFSTSQFFAL